MCQVVIAIDKLVGCPCNVRCCAVQVREAVLLNTLKRLMVAVPQYEGRINKWSGGYAQPPLGARHASDITTELGYEDVAPNVGAQFAQVSAAPLPGKAQ
jgi:hypothetical protein